ncbi:MAG TPA: hypothetical protein VMY37_12105 [Thermoguttaceae bacterium]|nr:hypothetical protein [Thermoguttaceae bacterium]
MRKWSRYLVGVVAVTGLFVLVTHAGAETCTLEMKRVDASARTSPSGQSGDFLARSTYPQSFFQQLGGPPGMIVGPSSGSKLKFSDVIKKEPAEYVTDTPFRGVAALGSQHYGFVLDVAPPEKDEKEDEGKDTEDDKEAGEKEESGGSLLSRLSKALVSPSPSQPKSKAVSYTRLYFDRNHNGDLTDDEAIEATSSRAYSTSMTRSAFPTVELTIDVDGKKLDYAFTFSVYSNVSSSLAYANASLNSAAYREGEITLDGKKRRIVLIDFNSNGRFDDAASVDERVRTSSGTVYPTMGDMLYIDPQSSRTYRNPYDATSGGDQYQVGKLIGIGGRFFDLKIDPSGDTLSLEPSSVPVGHVTNPNKGFRATVYGDQGMLQIAPDDSGKAPLPVGEWKLLSYTIERTDTSKPDSEAEKKDEEKSILEVLGSVLTTVTPPPQPPRLTFVSARATRDFKPVKVVKGETAEMRFGPPYKPEVSAPTIPEGQSSISLSMSLVGCGGEVCNSLRVNGSQPSAPEFTISTKDGEEVAAGKFKYG